MRYLLLACTLGILWQPCDAVAQTARAESTSASEETEPHIIGVTGTTLIGAGGYLDHVYSSERLLPVQYTIEANVTRFIASRLAIRGGLVGSSSRGGDDAEDQPAGTGVPAVHAHGGLFYYFTPRSMWSLYTGLSYWTQLTSRENAGIGTGMIAAGLEGALSARLHVYAEGGYGMGLSRATEATTRLVTYAGVRVRLGH